MNIQTNENSEIILNIVISSRNNFFKLKSNLKQFLNINNNSKKVNLLLIDDFSDEPYDLNVIELKKFFYNVVIIRNKLQKGKVRSILENTYLLEGKYILVLDDKDELINVDYFLYILEQLSNERENEKIFVSYFLDSNKQMIGSKIINGETYYQYYYASGKKGDHMFFIPLSLFKTFKIPGEISNFIINDETIYFQHIFNKPNYNFEIVKAWIYHDYKSGKLTKNILNSKIKYAEITNYVCLLILKTNPCFKIIISKLFELFLIRKKISLSFSKKYYKFLYYFLYLSGLFLVIKKIYLHEINKLLK